MTTQRDDDGEAQTVRPESWDTSCLDWEQRVRDHASLLPALPLHEGEAQKAVGIFNLLRLPDVQGTPRMREAAGEWFRDCVRALFGSYNPDTGVRHIQEIFMLVPKKNSKTTNGAALMLTALLVNRRPRAEFLLVAPTQEVADLAFRQAVGMIEADLVLAAKFHVQDHIKRIVYRKTGAFLKIKSFDPRVVTGSKPAGVLLDETHVIANAHDADRVVGQLRGGLISQPEGFLVQITTQSERPPSGVFAAELRKARAVRDGTLRAPILPLLYEFPRGVDWWNSKHWPMVLPNLGRSISIERLRSDHEAAQAAGPQELARWASQHLNVEIGVALLGDAWEGTSYWERQTSAEGLSLETLIERSDIITVGIDGGGLSDLLALAVIGRDAATGDWLHWGKAWAYQSVMERNKSVAGALRDFIADGDCVLIARLGDDVRELAQIVSVVQQSGRLDKIGVDPAGIGAILDALDDVGVEADRIVAVSQGWRMNNAIKTVERKLAEGSLWHQGSRLMAWAVGNAKVEPVGNAIRITKQASGQAKIDPVMAMLDAAFLMSFKPTRPPTFQVAFYG